MHSERILLIYSQAIVHPSNPLISAARSPSATRSSAQPHQVERSFEMSRRRGEDDGSVLKYVTEDEPKPARQIDAYLHLEAYLHLALASSWRVFVGWSHTSLGPKY